jgi:hypothetical protein
MSGENELALWRMKGGRVDLVVDKIGVEAKKLIAKQIRQSHAILPL